MPPENSTNQTTNENIIEKNDDIVDLGLNRTITLIFSNKSREKITKQFINVIELAIYDKKLQNVKIEIEYFENNTQLEDIIMEKNKTGKIFIGPIENQYSEIAKKFCSHNIVFFAFSSNIKTAGDCVYLINFFPKNELEEMFLFLEKDSKVALLYPENEYGYKINYLIDEIVNKTDVILVNRSSYKNDLSNVRAAIKELGKYELRKYELERQKKILSSKKDQASKKRLKKLQKFKTTNDYDFTHLLIADYGLNLMQVAPLLPYYDIDPNVVQFISTGVIDDDRFFYEPSLQGTIFPGVSKEKRLKLSEKYQEIYEERLLRVSTLPYDLVGILNYIFSRNLSFKQMLDLLENKDIKFEGVDGEFYFKNNMIERDLNILKISNGNANKIN